VSFLDADLGDGVAGVWDPGRQPLFVKRI